jgi:hypothetical protein
MSEDINNTDDSSSSSSPSTTSPPPTKKNRTGFRTSTLFPPETFVQQLGLDRLKKEKENNDPSITIDEAHQKNVKNNNTIVESSSNEVMRSPNLKFVRSTSKRKLTASNDQIISLDKRKMMENNNQQYEMKKQTSGDFTEINLHEEEPKSPPLPPTTNNNEEETSTTTDTNTNTTTATEITATEITATEKEENNNNGGKSKMELKKSLSKVFELLENHVDPFEEEDHSLNINLDENGRIRNATFVKIVEKLTDDKTGGMLFVSLLFFFLLSILSVVVSHYHLLRFHCILINHLFCRFSTTLCVFEHIQDIHNTKQVNATVGE